MTRTTDDWPRDEDGYPVIYPDGYWEIEDRAGQVVIDGKVYYPSGFVITIDKFQAQEIVQHLITKLFNSNYPHPLDGPEWKATITLSGALRRIEED